MILMDTHILLWAFSDSDRLTDSVRNAIDKNDVCISIASLWEIAIKAYTKFLLRHIQMRSGFFVLATRSGGRRCCSIVDRSDAKPERKRRPHLCMD